MKRMIVVTLLLAVAIEVESQEAKVIALDPVDSHVANEAWDNLQQAQKTWTDVQKLMTEKYLRVGYRDKEAGGEIYEGLTGSASFISSGNTVIWSSGSGIPRTKAQVDKDERDYQERIRKAKYYRRGWEDGFQFTSDFRYIVPKAAETPKQNSLWMTYPTTVSQ